MSLTTRQRTVLQTIRQGQKMTADAIGVRSDVLWRLEERGLVARSGPAGRGREKWHILQAGRDALDEYCVACGGILDWSVPDFGTCTRCGDEWPVNDWSTDG